MSAKPIAAVGFLVALALLGIATGLELYLRAARRAEYQIEPVSTVAQQKSESKSDRTSITDDERPPSLTEQRTPTETVDGIKDKNNSASPRAVTADSESFEMGVKAVKKDQYEAGIAHFTKAIEERPDYAKAYRNRGFTCISLCLKMASSDARRTSLLTKGIADITKALEIDDSVATAELFLLRGAAHFELEQDADAILDCDKGIELDSKNPRAYMLRGTAWYRIGTKRDLENPSIVNMEICSRGIKDMRKAVELDPSFKARVRKMEEGYNKIRILKGLPPD